jgi:electron transfer flavoprotein alpha subunit
MKIWAYLDHFQGQAVPGAWETLGLAKSLGSVTVLVFGENLGELADAAFEFGADDVLLADDPTLGFYRAEIYASTLSALAAAQHPDLILFPVTSRCREIAAMCAMDLGGGVLTDVIALEQTQDGLLATRPIYEGRLFEKVVCSASPVLMTLRPRAFPRPAREAGRRGRRAQVALDGKALTVVEGEFAEEKSPVSLTDAAVIVAGGRGILDEEKRGLALLEELAQVLGGAVAASRPPVEAGQVSAAQLVGQSGKIVSPNLYIAVGISGAVQHLAGIRSARVVVAINNDAQAPIFTASRYGVVGDLFQILPALIAVFKDS